MNFNNFTLVVFLFLSQLIFSQNDTIWYDNDWKEAIKSNASFYRPKSLKVDGKYLIKDFYKNGVLQMEGTSLKETEDFFDGKVMHYYQNGNLQSVTTYKNNIINGTVERYTDKGEIDMKVSFIDGKQNGDMILYYEKGKKRAIIPFRNNLEHGMLVAFDIDGNAIENKFYIEGKEISSRSEFNKKFYSSGVTTKGNIQIVNLDEAEERVSSLTKNQNNNTDQTKQKIIDFPNFMDMYENDNAILGVKRMTKTFDKKYFYSTSKDFEKIVFTIHHTKDGLYVMEKYDSYEPKENEIIFLYEEPDKVSLSTQKIYFKLGKKIKKAFQEKSLDGLQIIRFLEHRVFGVDQFSGMLAYSALEKEFKIK